MTGNSSDGVTRDVWPSRISFYFTAVGAAVGFGNVWRFPALCYSYGGGAFFIPYLIALFFVGLPILVLEIGFGQYFQSGDIGVFGGFHPRLRGVGLASVSCGFMLVTYYSMLIAWVVNAFFDSFVNETPFMTPGGDGSEAIAYFLDNIIGGASVGDDGRPTRLVLKNIGYSFLVWFIVFLGTGFGVKWTGRITYFTMGLPIILLFVFLGTSVSLPGAKDGIHAYIGEWDVSVLSSQGDVWSTAVSQIFFSIGVTFGIMTAFGSYCSKGDPVFVNSCVIAFANSLFSFISGFAVFAAIGHLADLRGVDVADVPFAGFSLVFGTWPVILGTLPGGIHWVRLLFFDLFLLGIDSAFGFMEAIVTVGLDTHYFQHTPKWKASLVLCFIGWLLSFIYATDAGLSFLDVIDFYINFVMILVGFLEVCGAGWVYGLGVTFKKLGAPAVLSYIFANLGSVIVACILWWGTPPSPDNLANGFIALIVIYLGFFAMSLLFLKLKMDAEPDKWTWPSILWELTFKNIFDLRDRIQPVCGWLPGIWCILIKQFLPHVLIIVFVNLARSKTSTGEAMFGAYGGYSMTPYQVLGILTSVFAIFLFSIGMIFPVVYSSFKLPDGHNSLEDESATGKDKTFEASKGEDGSNEEEDEVMKEQAAQEEAEA